MPRADRRSERDDDVDESELVDRGHEEGVALARALIRKPALLLADEPTASLDAANAASAAALLIDVARENAASLLIASHDQALLAQTPAIYRLEAGGLRRNETVRTDRPAAA